MSANLSRIAELIAERAPIAEQHTAIGQRLAKIDGELARLGVRLGNSAPVSPIETRSDKVRRVLSVSPVPMRLSDVARAVGASYGATGVVLCGLVKDGHVERIERGLYRIARAEGGA